MSDNTLPPRDRQQMESIVRAAQAAERIADLRPRWLKTPHINGQIQFLQSRHKIRVAIPGNGWGKTTTMAIALDMALQRDDPFNGDLLPKHPLTAVWVCQKFQQMEILRRQLEDEVWTRPWSWNQTRHFYEWPNKSQLHVVSSDSDWSNIQGIPVDFVCFDEHPDRKMWNEFMFRRRGKRKTRYMVAATMTLGMTWFIKEVIQEWELHHRKQGLNADQARDAQNHPDIWVWDKGGIRDNPSMDQDDITHYETRGHASDKELRVRLTGGYADFTGDSVFDHVTLDAMMADLTDGLNGSLRLIDPDDAKALVVPKGLDSGKILRRRIGDATSQKYVEFDPDGFIEGGRFTLYEPPDLSGTYVMGADFAAGLEGRDYDAVVILRKREDGICEQVAEAHGWWGDMTTADIIHMAARWYFNAFLCGERQFGLPCLRRLYDEYHYPYIFRARHESTRSRRPSDLLGHHRSSGDTIIPNLRAAVNRRNIVIRSKRLMEELRQYQFRPRVTTVDPETATSDQLVTSAPSGMNDDLVMALAYAWHAAREVTKFTMPLPDYAPGTYGAIFDNARVLAGVKPRREPTPKYA